MRSRGGRFDMPLFSGIARDLELNVAAGSGGRTKMETMEEENDQH